MSARGQVHVFECDPGEPVLYAGLREGIGLPYECSTGTCGTCKARLVTGELVDAWPEAPGRSALKAGRGELLMCQALAKSDCELAVAVAVKTAAEGAMLPVHVGGALHGLRPLTHDVAAFDVELERPLAFEAGQFVVLDAPGISGGRAYSMVNWAEPAARLAFVVKRKPGGRVSDWLWAPGAEGTPVRLFGPLGQATFDPALGRNLVLIAGGSGIAGMMSILARACNERYFDGHAGFVFFGVRSARDVFFLDELDAFRAGAGGRLAVTVALSDEPVDAALAMSRPSLGFAQGLVHAVAAEAMRGKFDNVRAYVAGPPPMVDAALRMLMLEAKLTPDNIRYDRFS